MSVPIFNRVKKVFKIVQLPKVVTVEDYGVEECCDIYNVFAEINKTEDWKNDVTSDRYSYFFIKKRWCSIK